jgi:hypothetical protein
MQQRRVRLGDILDDYCPRERRITNHAVVAMIDDAIKQTRCTTCDADHEYKGARVPAPRRRKAGALTSADLEAGARPRPAMVDAEEPVSIEEPIEEPETFDAPEPIAAAADAVPDGADGEAAVDDEAELPADDDRDEWPVHRPLIRATLPRPEGQVPERKAPEFTVGRFDSQRNNGQRNRGHRPMRHGQGQGQGQPPGQGQRFGGPRQGSGQGPRQAGQGGPRHGSGQNAPQGQRQQGNRPPGPGGGRPAGQGRGPRPGGAGRKRGR